MLADEWLIYKIHTIFFIKHIPSSFYYMKIDLYYRKNVFSIYNNK